MITTTISTTAAALCTRMPAALDRGRLDVCPAGIAATGGTAWGAVPFAVSSQVRADALGATKQARPPRGVPR